jgi:hypothetical protein
MIFVSTFNRCKFELISTDSDEFTVHVFRQLPILQPPGEGRVYRFLDSPGVDTPTSNRCPLKTDQ